MSRKKPPEATFGATERRGTDPPPADLTAPWRTEGLVSKPLTRAFLSVEEFAVVVGLSENTVLRRIRDEEIRATRIGRLWRIPVTEVGRLLGRGPAQPTHWNNEFGSNRR
jgi:excisionase family DNA binding protein